MFCAVKSNSPLSAPRDETARASCGNGAKKKILSLTSSRSEDYLKGGRLTEARAASINRAKIASPIVASFVRSGCHCTPT